MSARGEIEALGQDLVDELLRAGKLELQALATEISQDARDRVQQALIALGRLLAKKAQGRDDLEQEIAFEMSVLRGYAAVSAVILARAQERLLDDMLQVAGRGAVKAAEILLPLLRDMAIAAVQEAIAGRGR